LKRSNLSRDGIYIRWFTAGHICWTDIGVLDLEPGPCRKVMHFQAASERWESAPDDRLGKIPGSTIHARRLPDFAEPVAGRGFRATRWFNPVYDTGQIYRRVDLTRATS